MTEGTCRRARVTISARDAMAQDSAEALQKKEAEAEERRRESHNLVAESIWRELAESACLRSHFEHFFDVSFHVRGEGGNCS
jgi:hypothetical protein